MAGGKPDVGISVGIIPENSGARVIKTSLDEITKESAKADAASQKLAQSQMRLVAQNNALQASVTKAAAAQLQAGNAMQQAEQKAARLAVSNNAAAVAAQRLAAAEKAAMAATLAAANAMAAAELKARQLAEAKRKLDEAGQKNAVTFGNLKNLIGGYIGVQTIIQTIKLADQYTLINARLKDIAGSTSAAKEMMGQLRTISNQTGTEISSSLSILQRLSFVREEIKATNADMVNFTSTVTKLGVISGATQDAQKFGLTQLGQALSSQYMRAEEFNSIMENIPAVGKQIADGLGVSTGQLRQLVVQGKLLSSDVFAVLLNQTDEISAKFEQMPMTASKGLQILKNDLGAIVEDMNNATNGASNFGIVLEGIGKGAKQLYIGLTGVFQNIVALVLEAINGVGILINQANKAGAWVANLNPFGDKKIANLYDTADPGSFFMASVDRNNEMRNRIFAPAVALEASEKRTISQDYKKIAAELKDKKENDAAKKAAREAAAEQKRQQQELQSAINGSRTEFEKLNDEIAHLEKLKSVAKTTRDVELLNRGIANTQAELEKLRVKYEVDSPLVKTFKDVAEEIQGGFKDAFKSAFDSGEGSAVAKFFKGIRASFKSMLLDLAYQAAVKPIIVSVLAGVGGSLGISNGALNSVLGAGSVGGASSGISGLGSLASIGSSLFNGGLYSSTLGNIGSGVGNFLAGNGYSAMGPFLPGSAAGIGAAAFGNLGYGAIGSLGASLFGLGSQNMVINGIGSTAGSLIGGAFGGPIGAAIGGFAGSALSGLFGGSKPSDATAEAVINFSSGNIGRGDLGSKTSQQNLDYREAILKQLQDTISLVGKYGGSVAGNTRENYIQIGNRDGLRYNYQNYGTDSSAFQSAIFSDLKNSITGLTGTFKTIFDKVGTNDLSGLSNAFAFGESYDAVLKGTSTANTLADAIKALDDNMNALVESARSLGLPLEDYTAALAKQKEVAIGALKAQQAGFTSLEEMTRTFDQFFNGQALGDSSLTPQQKLEAAQSNFGSLLSKAQGGDLSVTQDLLSSAQTLINQGRDVYASGVDYSNLEGFVRSSVRGVATQAGYDGQNIAYSIVSTNQQLVQTGENTNAAIDSMKAELFRLSNLLQSLVKVA